MARKITSEPEPEVAEPEVTETPVVESAPIEIVDLDEAIQAEALTPAEQQAGVNVFFGEVGMLDFADKSKYHIRSHHARITDQTLIANLKAHAERYPTAKIFITE